MNDLTIVTGFWNIRRDRNEAIYLKNFKNLLDISKNMVIFIPKIYENFVLESRSTCLDITKIVIVELDDIKNFYFKDYWNILQSIRTNPKWVENIAWLKNSPQYFSEWYNPIVMSKVFFIKEVYDKKYFDTEKLIWMDAGMTQHISKELVTNLVVERIADYVDKIFFTSIPYKSWEIHGFPYEGYKKYTNNIPNWLCRATIFGCDKNYVNKFVEDYKYYLKDTLDRDYLGTEESIFTLLSVVNSEIYGRYHMPNASMPDGFLKDIKV